MHLSNSMLNEAGYFRPLEDFSNEAIAAIPSDTPLTQMLATGRGLALSNDKVAYLESGSIRLESVDGNVAAQLP